ncbi:flavin-dependent oxidoreductase [Virgisporangium aliadipatigenens]|uniref:Flavin-dependent oxidoreductase n=1 Tax=Virgisporangium aliadipatigenens TaxID=741659 RepID=A0A8J4DTN0_9ACTN|nr:flavin-dependent oxidoreductase [Virgisporangium aliadipatigenens]GIJ50365.1 flavin-dependent oxidoreductase [Virgisporangium aliadipatigenens]
MRVVIAGAGIGGLTLALSLHAAGLRDVRLLEAAPRIDPLGVGLNILPSAVRELFELGLGDRLVEVSVRTGALSYYDRHGNLIWTEPRGLAAGYRWPQLSVHRGLLQSVLHDAVRERLGADAVRTDCRVRDLTVGTGVRVEVEHSSAGDTSTVDADVLVGADGIHSAVRGVLYPRESEPPWNGLLVWRGAVRRRPFLDGNTMIIAGDERRRAVVYPMTGLDPAGTVLMNWALARPAGEEERPRRADWNRPVPPEAFLDAFADLSFDWLDVPALVRACGTGLEYPMVDREPLPRWSFGPVTLLGDAAHAMYPMGSNGATQSVLDARVLAAHLAGDPDVTRALRGYERERRPITTALQEAGRRMGPEQVITLAAQRAPDGFTHVHDVIPAAELAAISHRYAHTGAFDVETVNTRPSYDVRTGRAGARP